MDAELEQLNTDIARLEPFITDHKKSLMQSVIQHRTRYLTVALEDIYQPHNASAVLRTADLTGVQDIHIIEQKNAYRVNPDVALGASKWLNLIHYRDPMANNTIICMNALRDAGYRLVATSPHEHGYGLSDLPLDRPIALFFGTEKDGLTDSVLNAVDAHLMIEMVGFTESFNISVSAALCLYRLKERLRVEGHPWKLGEIESRRIYLDWCRGIVRNADQILQAKD